MSYVLAILLASLGTLIALGYAAKKYPTKFDAAIAKLRGQ